MSEFSIHAIDDLKRNKTKKNEHRLQYFQTIVFNLIVECYRNMIFIGIIVYKYGDKQLEWRFHRQKLQCERVLIRHQIARLFKRIHTHTETHT